jgi:serine/threonine protein kinase
MELCVLNLEEYVKQNLRSEFGVDNFYNPSYKGELGFLSLWSITDQIAAALEFLHTQRELHRDVKPTNGKNLELSHFLLSLRFH